MAEGDPAKDGPRSVDTGLAYRNDRDKKDSTFSFSNPARLPDGVIDAMPGIPGNHDFKRLTTNDTELMGPVDPKEMMGREEHKEAFRDMVIAPLDDKRERRRNQANAFWYDMAKNLFSPGQQLLMEQETRVDREVDNQFSNTGTSDPEQTDRHFGSLKKLSEETGYSMVDTLVETPLKLAASAAYGADNYAKNNILNLPDRYSRSPQDAERKIEEFFEWASLQPPEREQPSKEERIQAVEKEVRKRAGRFNIDLDEIPEGERKVARDIVRKTKTASDVLHSRAASAGDISANIMQSGLAMYTEMAAFSKTLSMVPKGIRTGKVGSLATGLPATSLAGGLGEVVWQYNENKTPDQIARDFTRGSYFNLSLSALGLWGKAFTSDTVVPLFKKADEVFNASIDPKKLGNIKRAAKEFDAAFGSADESVQKKRALEFKNELTTLDEISDAYPDQIRRKFRGTFRNIDSSKADDAMGEMLNYRYGKKNLENLDPEEKLEFDAWLHEMRESGDAYEAGAILERIDDDIKNLDSDEAMQEFLDRSSFLNDDAIEPEKLRSESPFMRELLDYGGEGGSLESLIKQTENINEPPLRSSFKEFTKALGPRHILAKKSQEASVNDVPLLAGYWDVQHSHRSMFKKFNKGIELPDGTKIPGAEKVDQVFKKNGMYMKENWEKQEELFNFLIHKEYDPRKLTDEEMAKAGLDENQRNVAKFIRDTFDKLGKATDVEPDRLIRNYVPRRLKTPNSKQAKAVIDDAIEVEESFFEKNRKIGELTLEDMRELERKGVEFKKDMQEGLRSYLYSFLRKREVEPALGKFDELVNKLKAEEHPDAKTWEQWSKEMRGKSENEMTAGRRLMKGIANQIEKIDRPTAKKISNWFANNRPSDAIMAATYGNYLWAKQFFRLKNVSQSALTVLERGVDNVANAHRWVRNKGDIVDEMMGKSEIINEVDQFLEVTQAANAGETSGSGMIKGMFKKIGNKIGSFDNISASHGFNSRRAFLSGPLGLNKNISKYKNGDLTFKQLAKQSGFETMRPVPKSMMKQKIDEGRIGAVITEGGERISIEEALKQGKDEIGDFTFDKKSAEFMLGRNSVVDTQWEYGKGAMGYLYWQNEGPAANNALWKDWLQGGTLPFTTWPINYAYKGMKWAKNPNLNADKLIAYTTMGKAYTDAVGRVFDADTDEWMFGGPLNNMTDLFIRQPGASAARGGLRVLMNEESRMRNMVEKMSGKNEKLPWYIKGDLRKGYRNLSSWLVGGTVLERGYEVTKPLMDATIRALTEGAMDSEDFRKSLEGIIGQEFVQEARNGSQSARKDVLETLQDKGGTGGSGDGVLDVLQDS